MTLRFIMKKRMLLLAVSVLSLSMKAQAKYMTKI